MEARLKAAGIPLPLETVALMASLNGTPLEKGGVPLMPFHLPTLPTLNLHGRELNGHKKQITLVSQALTDNSGADQMCGWAQLTDESRAAQMCGFNPGLDLAGHALSCSRGTPHSSNHWTEGN